MCQAWRGVFSGDDRWLNKLTMLAAEHPALANLDAAEGESTMACSGQQKRVSQW